MRNSHAFLQFSKDMPKLTVHMHTQLQKYWLTPIIHFYILAWFYIQWCLHKQIYTKNPPHAHHTPLNFNTIIHTEIFTRQPVTHTRSIIHTRNCDNLHTDPIYIATLSENVASETHHGMKQRSIECAAHVCTSTKHKSCDTKTRCISRKWAQTKETWNCQKDGVILLTTVICSSNHQWNARRYCTPEIFQQSWRKSPAA